MLAAAPANSAAPSISGLAREAETLTASAGTWTGTPTISYAYQWRRCNTSGGACVNIPGALGLTYTLLTSDVGSTIRFQVVATNAVSSVTATSVQTAVVAPLPPASTSLPSISGMPADGQALATTNGGWAGTPTITYSYQWQRCTPSCASISGATAATYQLVSTDVGATIRVVVTATNPGGTSSAISAETVAIAPVAPSSTGAPAISGTARDGLTLAASIGTWAGTTPQSAAYEWRRCDAAGGSCVAIAGATAGSYTAVAVDVGGTLRVAVTQTNLAGSATAVSDRTSIVAAAAPANTAAPGITGTPKDGSTLTADPGGWSGTPTIAYAYQWRRCNPGCVDIAGAASQTYVLQPADVAATIRVVVTASNAGGSATATSTATPPIQPFPPANTASPAVSGLAEDGSMLTAAPGSWTGIVPIGYAYRWWRCDSGGGNCSPIVGALAQQYEVVGADVGLTLKVEVTGTNSDGSASAFSAVTAIVVPSPPQSLTAPTLSGYLGIGETLTADPGSWAGSPTITFAYAWLRCDAFGASCLPIAGETGQTYLLALLDLGARLRARVQATNVAGNVSVDSAATWGVIRDDPPLATAPPSIVLAPLAAQGLPLAVQLGSWSGFVPMSASYRWRRCDTLGSGCADIAGATSATYTPVSGDIGMTIRVVITMDNGIGVGTATSDQVGPVLPAPPLNLTPPAITGVTMAGVELSGAAGNWSGGEPITLGYSWLRCDGGGNSCTAIAGATSARYTAVDADIGATLRLRVTATNVTQAVSAESLPVGPVLALPPAALATPSVALKDESARLRPGTDLLGSSGSWNGSAPLVYAYRWQRCASETDCADVPGATQPTYTVTDADVDRRLRLLVLVANPAGTVAAASALTDVVEGAPPEPVAPPRVLGTPKAGNVLTADVGEWSGTPTLRFAYSWQRCKQTGKKSCEPIEKATHRRLTVTEEEVGWRIVVVVTAVNDIGRAEERSRPSTPVRAIPPSLEKGPFIPKPAGAIAPGTVLEADLGGWSGTKPIDFSVTWLRCRPGGAACREVSDSEQYRLRESDLIPRSGGREGSRQLAFAFRIVVRARNAGGRAEATSTPFGALGPPPNVRVRAGDVALADAAHVSVTLRCQAKAKRACAGQASIRADAFDRFLRFRLRPGAERTWRLALAVEEQALLSDVGSMPATLVVRERGRRSITRTFRLRLAA